MVFPLTLFVFGFALLLKGADILTDAAAEIAKKLGVANFIVGVVIVGVGTSLPELIVAIFSNLQEAEKIGVGAVVGSNTFNILFILGVSAIISPLILTRGEVWRHLPMNIAAVSAVGVLVFLSGSFFGLNKFAGILLLALFFGWIGYLYFINKYILEGETPVSSLSKERPEFLNIVFMLAGLVGIVVGGGWVTDGAIAIAREFKLSESLMGLTIVGAGTSLPELFVSAVAARKKNYGIALGNVIGSNIFDFLMILGLASAIKPIPFTRELFFDLWITAAASLTIFISMFLGRKYVLKRWQGAIFIFLYIAYLGHLLLRGS